MIKIEHVTKYFEDYPCLLYTSHRIRIDGDGLGKLTHRRQFFPCCHLPGHDLFLELIHDLLVDGLAAF